jgi:predicted dehydrogenase
MNPYSTPISSTPSPRASRRRFLQLAGATSLAFPAIVRAASLHSRFQIAAIGTDGKGLSDLSEIGSHPHAQLVAFCDVDASRFAKADQRFPGVPHYRDLRQMLSQLGDKLDGVIVSTPDHTHAFAAMEAMRLGKHVYCQKPLTHTVWEARQMRLLAARKGVRTQMGNQIHSASEYRTAVRLIREGVIGKIRSVHSWQKNAGNQHTKLTAPPASGPVPDSLEWDLWLGGAPFHKYCPEVYHPFKWRDWVAFGAGTLGDFGCHILDPVFTALELTAPLRIRAENEGLNPHTWPAAETISYVFPGTRWTADASLPVTWYDGGRRPVISGNDLPDAQTLPAGGSLFIGEGGSLVLPHVGMPQLFPREKFANMPVSKEPASNHYHAWVDAVLTGRETSDNFAYAGPLTEAVQLGNIATRHPGVELHWDAAAMRFPGHPGADSLLKRAYREGWNIQPVE